MAGKNDNDTGTQVIKREALRILKEKKGEEVYLKDIRKEIELNRDRRFSAGMYSGAMRDLTQKSNSRVVNVKRGVYMYVDNAKKARINKVLDNCISELEDIGYINILEANAEDMTYIEKIPEIINKIKSCKIT